MVDDFGKRLLLLVYIKNILEYISKYVHTAVFFQGWTMAVRWDWKSSSILQDPALFNVRLSVIQSIYRYMRTAHTVKKRTHSQDKIPAY